MSKQLLNEKAALIRLNAAHQQTLIIEIDDQTQETLSGGGLARFERSKPHVNVSN